MVKVKYEEPTERNFEQEAMELLSNLRGNQFYEMYEIVSEKLKRFNSPIRDQELKAVKVAIEKTKGIDQFRLKRIWEGYRSEMARTARPKDGFTKPAKKKV